MKPATARLPRPRHLHVVPTPIRPERRGIQRVPVAHRLTEPTQMVLGLPVRLHVIEGGAAAPEPVVPAVALRRAA